MTISNSRANRGKLAEKEVQRVLDQWNKEMQSFAYHRLPDARSARGALAAQPADYMYWLNGSGGFIEVKETEHDFRLARDKISQLATLRKFALAGAVSYVVVYHSVIKKWRVFNVMMLNGLPPSWDLSALPTYETASEALSQIKRTFT